jgi:ribonuclease HI
MDEVITLNFDGGSRGNPGIAGIGVVLFAADSTPIVTLGKFIGRATNNFAEYMALIVGLREAKKLGVKKLVIRGDSELIIKQMRGEYRVKNPGLKDLYDQAQKLLADFPGAKLEHNLREHNSLADKLANLAMDRGGDVTDIDPTPASMSERARNRFSCKSCGCQIEVKRPSSAEKISPFVCQCGNTMDEGY